MQFLKVVQNKYTFIMHQVAPNISQYFTEMTQVINEGNSYEFPSIDLHKAIINKLILNDKNHFKQFFLFIKKSYKQYEQFIKQNHPEFAQTMETFIIQVD